MRLYKHSKGTQLLIFCLKSLLVLLINGPSNEGLGETAHVHKNVLQKTLLHIKIRVDNKIASLILLSELTEIEILIYLEDLCLILRWQTINQN